LETDSEFDPSLVFVVWSCESEIVGVAHCWTSAFVKDLAVHPDWRRRGIGKALLCHAFAIFKSRGAARVRLKVQSDNPSGAIRLYHEVGMRPISQGVGKK